jgi:hypothetical protein
MVQVAYSVRDIRAAAWAWNSAAGVGPFHVVDHVRHESVVTENGPIRLDQSIAVTWCGNVMLELVEFHADDKTEVVDWLVAPRGLHHLACFVPDLDATFDATRSEGSRYVEARTADARYLMVDTTSTLGYRSEYYEETEYMRDLYDGVRRSSERWNGIRLIRG